MRLSTTLLLLFSAILLGLLVWSQREGFTSPGTLVQLTTSRPDAVYWVRRRPSTQAPPPGGIAYVAFG